MAPPAASSAGRAAFLALSCVFCHRVAGEEGFPKPVSANPGPTLGAYLGREAPANVAMSILLPSFLTSFVALGVHFLSATPNLLLSFLAVLGSALFHFSWLCAAHHHTKTMHPVELAQIFFVWLKKTLK